VFFDLNTCSIRQRFLRAFKVVMKRPKRKRIHFKQNLMLDEDIHVQDILGNISFYTCARLACRDATGGGGEGDSNGNGNGGSSSGGGGRDDEDDGLESNHDNATGIEWWWWWKWQQARLRSQEATRGSHLWPVDAALQVVANEVRETIEPAVRAIVMEPLREHTKHGLILFLVVGAFVVACMEMVAGLAVVSMGLSLGFLATLGSAFLWWSWKHRASSPNPPPHNGSGNKNENG